MTPNQLFTRKKIIVIGIFLLLVWFASWLYTRSFLEITTGEEKPDRVLLIKEGQEAKEIKIESEKTRLFIPKGEYKIEAVKADKQTTFYRELKSLRTSKVAVEFSTIKQTEHIGESDKSCAKDEPESGRTIFYPCRFDLSTVVESTFDGLTLTPVLEDFEILGENISLHYEQFADGILFLYSDGTTLTAETIINTNRKEIIKINNFTDSITEDTFAVSSSRSKTSIHMLDRNSKTLYSVDDINNGSLRKTDLSGHIITDEIHNNKLYANQSNIYISNIIYPETELGDDEVPEGVNFNQNIVILEPAGADNKRVISLPEEARIDRLEVSQNGEVLFTNLNDALGTFYILRKDGKTTKLPTAEKTLNFCWNDKDSFYYASEDGGSIYLFSITKAASFLVYKNEAAKAGNITCHEGQLYFTFVQEDDPEELHRHFKLLEKEQSGTRAETLFPLYIELDNGLATASLYRGTVTSRLLYSDSGQPLSGSEINNLTENVKSQLVDSGVNLSSLRFDYK